MLLRLFALIRRLRELQIPWDIFLNLDWEKIVSLFQVPDVEDEAAFREWCRLLVEVAEGLATKTPNPLDDELVRVLANLLESEAAWGMFYRILCSVLLDGNPLSEAVRLIEEDQGLLADVCGGVDDPRFSPATLIAIITMVIQLIQSLRK